MNFKIACFITKDSPYVEVAQKYLLPSLAKLNIKPIVIETENYHNWNKNVAQKPLVALQLLKEHNTNIVLLDVDAKITQYPILFDTINCDIAFHTLNWDTWYQNNNGVKEVLSGTLFLANNDKVKSLCQEWHEEVVRTGAWEQKGLSTVLSRKKDISIFNLPIEYTWINSLPNGDKPYVKPNGKIIIRHFQASREYKRKIL